MTEASNIAGRPSLSRPRPSRRAGGRAEGGEKRHRLPPLHRGLLAFALLSVGGLYALVLGAGQNGQRVSQWLSSAVWQRLPPPIHNEGVNSVAALRHLFQGLGYDIHRVAEGQAEVPRLFLASLPPDLPRVDSTEDRKRVFVKLLLPLVLHVDDTLRWQRHRIETLEGALADGRKLSPGAQAWLTQRFAEYGVPEGDFQGLLMRVDVIPPSLALAQAAIETGWGTSRFARQGNALFGQYASGGDVLVPEQRDDIALKSFDYLIDSVRAYAHNLNTHPAYAAFRRLRAELRAEGRPATGLALAAGLSAYSERGDGYVRAVRAMIRDNTLEDLDNARLTGTLDGST